MRVLSVRPPWANLIALGIKTVELRSWQTAYRGPLAIHAGLRVDKEAIRHLLGTLPHYKTFIEDVSVLGAIVAISELSDIFPYPGISDYFCDADKHRAPLSCFINYGWHLPPGKPRKLETPVVFRGRQGLFNIPDDLLGL